VWSRDFGEVDVSCRRFPEHRRDRLRKSSFDREIVDAGDERRDDKRPDRRPMSDGRRGGDHEHFPRPSDALITACAVLGYSTFRCTPPSPYLRHAMTKWPHHPNLRKKPHAPSKGRGPVQRAIRRVFMASGAEVLNSTEIYDWAHGRRRFGRRKSMPFGVYSRTLRTLRAMCEPVGRAPTIGRPWLWRLRNSHEDTR
jgi:hypothetical protein